MPRRRRPIDQRRRGIVTSVDERRWVIGFDGSESSKSAARWAAAHAEGRAASLCLLHAWSIATATVYSVFEPVILADNIQAVEHAAHDELESFAAELGTVSPVPIDRILVHGDPSTALLDAAGDSTQLVLGARGAGLFDRLLLGSTSTRCATHATVPTVIVREQFNRPPAPAHRIVVGLDGSDNARAAVDWACAFASPGSTVDIVAVWEFSPSLFSGEPIYFPEAVQRARDQFEEQTADLPPAARRADITVNTSFLQGSQREQLATRAADADLLVVGARGRGAIGSALLGSVSTWLLHHVDRPMAIVPPPTSARIAS